MKSYLNDANASDINHLPPQCYQKATSSPPMLEIFIVLNEKDTEKKQGEGKGGKGGGKGGRHTHTRLFFFESNKYLGLPPKKRLL